MENIPTLLIYFVSFAVILMASKQIGIHFNQVRLPLISGFLFTGIIAGPHLLGLLSHEEVESLKFVDEMSLAFIAFAAGGELNLQVVRGYLRGIIAIIASQVVTILGLGILAFTIVGKYLPFTQAMSSLEVFAIGLLGASIMVARSPSSAYAVIREIRAKGPFTQKVLGSTVLTDAVVIVLFAAAVSIADVIFEGAAFNFIIVLFLLFEILLDIILGLIIGLFLRWVMSLRWRIIKGALILGAGYCVFIISSTLHNIHIGNIPVGIFSEPLLICMVAGFYVGNFTRYAQEFHRAIEDLAPTIFILFFTLVGAELELVVLEESWMIILALVAVRLIGIVLGSFLGGTIAGDPIKHNALLGLTFVTQAGVSVGLAREIGVEFPVWGNNLTTISIGVIVVSQVLGPPLIKWAISFIGEAHPKGEPAPFDGVRDAIIFGYEGQAITLSQQLLSHGWGVKIICDRPEVVNAPKLEVEVQCVEEFTLESLREVGLDKAEALVALMSDEENYKICELAYEHFGTKDMVVRLNDRKNFDRFHQLGALIVDPNTAMVGLMDHLVRSPVAASVLLGMEPDQDIVDIQVCDPNLAGVAIRDLRLPQDTLIMSVTRDGHLLVSHGYTRLSLGDQITVIGARKSLDEVMLLCS